MFFRSGDKIVLEGEADQIPGRKHGDIVFILAQEEHEVFERSGADLRAAITVTLAEALTGFNRVVLKHLDGRGIEINHPAGKVLVPGQILKIAGEGMPIKRTDARGNLFLMVDIKFPDPKEDSWSVSPAVVEQLRGILPKSTIEPIEAEVVEPVNFDPSGNEEEYGANDHDEQWEDEEEEEGAQCVPQ